MQHMTRRGFFQLAGAASASPALLPFAAEAGQAAVSASRVENDIVFGKGGDMDLKLDIYHPAAGTEKRMAIIHIHGGGFAGGSKAGVASSSRAFAGLGYVSIASQYRLTGQSRWPAQIEDVKAAIRWTRANASRLNIDAGKIAVSGYSAGGLMALFAAGTQDHKDFDGNGGNAGVSTKVSACVAFYPATTANANLLPEGSDRAAIDAASATNHISPSFAPTIFLHGLADTTIRPENTLAFFEKLRAAGVKVDLHLFQGAPHAFEVNNPDAALAAAQVSNLFFDRLILNPKEYPPFGGGRGGRGGARGGQ
jgi:acetyl esterase/lipase